MGIKDVLGKTISYIGQIVGIKSDNILGNKNKNSHKIYSSSACSIGSVLNNILGQQERIGDKFESSKKDTKAENEIKKETVEKQQKTKKTEKQVEEKENINTITPQIKEQKAASEEELNKVRVTLRNKCKESDIDFAKLSINMAALTGKTFIEFSKMNKNLQITLLNYLIESIERVNKANVPDVNKLEAVVTDAALMYHFITHDKKGNEYSIENLSIEELRKRRLSFETKMKARKEEKIKAMEGMTKEEKAVAMEELKKEMAGYRKHIFDELSKKIPFESAMELILIVSSKDVGEAAKQLMESYPIEIREKIANTMQSFESFKEYINTVKRRGEDLGDEKALAAFEQYHKVFGTYKTKENLENYEKQFVASRANGEFSPEISKATAMGIGEAAYANINMNSEEKETFIKQWVTDNDGFLTDADMIKVEQRATEYIKELLEKNPKIKENFAKVKTNIKEIVEKTLNRIINDKTNNVKQEKKSDNNAKFKQFITSPNREIKTLNKEVLSFTQIYIRELAEKFERPAVKKSEEEITVALLKGIIDEKQALKNLDNSEHKFIKMCVQNSTLSSKYDERIRLYIQTEKDEKKLKAIAEVAPHDIVVKIVQNMRGNKQKLASDLIKRHEVDTNTTVLLEKYTEKEAV